MISKIILKSWYKGNKPLFLRREHIIAALELSCKMLNIDLGLKYILMYRNKPMCLYW